MNEKKQGHVEDGGMSKEQRTRLIRETEEKIKQSPIYQFCAERGMEEETIDSAQKTSRYDAEAVRRCQRAAETGDSDAMCTLAEMYSKGDGVTKDTEKALYWFLRAAEAGNSTAMYHLAGRYDFLGGSRNSGEDYTKAVKWYTKAAEAGRSDAMNRLGWMYLVGQGVGKDCEKATEWFHKSAEAWNISAMDILASNYERGIGVTRNYEKAVEWYRKAAQRGHNGAKKRLRKLGELS